MGVAMRWAAFLGITVVVCLGAACATDGRKAESTTQPRSADSRFEFSRVIMGVRARIVLYAPSHDESFAATEKAFGRLGELDAIMSDYRPESELRRLCRAEAGEVHAIGKDLYRVLRSAKDIAEASDGSFDPTVGPLVELWRGSRREGRLPPAPLLKAAMEKTGHRRLRLVEMADGRHGALLATPGMALDLGGIAKGYAAGEARDLIKEAGYPACLVALSGDISVGDAPPGEAGWQIEIGVPTGSVGVLLLSNSSVSTSGDSEQFAEIGGVRYSHLVDPRTGLGVTNGVACTVIGKDGGQVDALASAGCVAGREAAVRMHTKTSDRAWSMVVYGGEEGDPPTVVDPGNLIRWATPPAGFSRSRVGLGGPARADLSWSHGHVESAQ